MEAWRLSYHVVVSVSDSVAGMEHGRVERASGGGAGDMPIDELLFCKTFLEEKQAQMDILSIKGMGTTMTLTLPI